MKADGPWARTRLEHDQAVGPVPVVEVVQARHLLQAMGPSQGAGSVKVIVDVDPFFMM